MNNTPSPRPRQPPEGFKLLAYGQTVSAGDISRSPITDSWSDVNEETIGHTVNHLNDRQNIFARQLIVHVPDRGALTDWMKDTDSDHCFMRCLVGADPSLVASRVAFIEKTPRVRNAAFTETADFQNWLEGPKGCAPEYGEYQPSRDWCDEQLVALGYTL